VRPASVPQATTYLFWNFCRFVEFPTQNGAPMVPSVTHPVKRWEVVSMSNAFDRAERCHEWAEECRRLSRMCRSAEMKIHYSRMSEHYSSLADAELAGGLAYEPLLPENEINPAQRPCGTLRSH
jgi:hypothetical protein